jgi:hypothetical protein
VRARERQGRGLQLLDRRGAAGSGGGLEVIAQAFVALADAPGETELVRAVGDQLLADLGKKFPRSFTAS